MSSTPTPPPLGDMLSLPDGRKVHLVTAGPADSDKPVVVLLHGLGGSTFEWVAVIRELAARNVRVVCADRAGQVSIPRTLVAHQSKYWPSDPPAEDVQPTLPWLARDLRLVLETAGVKPPLVLVGQSYGGDIARQCMLDWPGELIAGMVVVDSPVKRFEQENAWQTLLGPSNYQDVVGLATNSALTPDEQAAMHDADTKSEAIQAREFATALADGATQLSLIGYPHPKQLLGTKPLSVMFCSTVNDFQKIYNHGVEHGYGDESAREEMRNVLEFFRENHEADMRVMLGYTGEGRGRFVETEGRAATHNVHVVDPGCVAGEVEWVLERVET